MEGLTEGRMVHYVMQDGEHRPAVVVKVWRHSDNGLVNLVVFIDGSNDDPLIAVPVSWVTSRVYSETKEPGTWHWIEPA